MIHALFDTVFYLPLYNALVWLSAVLPGHNLALAIIVLTIIVRLILFPLQHSMSHTQRKLRELDGTIRGIKEKHAKDSAEQAKQIMALYKEHGINPFAGFFVLIIQLPILLALYWVALAGSDFDTSLLYSFVTKPEILNTSLFGLLDVTKVSYFLAVLVGVSQFVQVSLTLPPLSPEQTDKASLKDSFARSMRVQMKYVLPIFVILISTQLPSAVSIYWVTSNIFSIGHELYVGKKARLISMGKLKT